MPMPTGSVNFGMTHTSTVGLNGVPSKFNASGQNHLLPMIEAYASTQMLKRMMPFMVFEKFGQTFELPTNSTATARFRRYLPLDSTPVELEEGVTPANTPLDAETFECTLKEYGAVTTISNRIFDLHPDKVVDEAVDVLGEQAAQMMERARIAVLEGGITQIYRPGASALVATRVLVNNKLTTALQRNIVRTFMKNNVERITKIVKSTPSFNTEAISGAYVAICHPNLIHDIRSMTNFVDAKNYGSVSAWENEIGSVEDVRYLTTTLMPYYTGQGADKGATWEGTDATATTKADVYPVIFLGKDAYGIIPLKGKSALTPSIIAPSKNAYDPLGQRGYVGWKAYQTTVILNPYAIAKAEVCCSVLGV